jgi:hypothetical protein
MTGEMFAVNADGLDSNGDCWAVHAAIARAVGGTLEPFDVYQGPYICVGEDSRIGRWPYSALLPGPCRLWLDADESGLGTVYREDTGTVAEYWPESDETAAVEAARSLLAECWSGVEVAAEALL